MSADRDYAAEMADRIAEVTAGSGWIPSVVAGKLHARLLESDTELLDGWLHAMAVRMLVQAIRDGARHQRAVARTRAGSRAFAEAARDFEGAADGERKTAAATLTGMFHVKHQVLDGAQGVWKSVADMTGPDHLYVAETQYRQPAAELKMLEAFHRAVAKKIGKRRTADVLSEEQYEELYRSITTRPAGKKAAA